MGVLILFVCLLGMFTLGVMSVDMDVGPVCGWALLILLVMAADVVIFC